jgi:hypothetical protein
MSSVHSLVSPICSSCLQQPGSDKALLKPAGHTCPI